MAEEFRQIPKREYSSSPDLRQIALYIEDHARVLQESGWTKDAADLLKWAGELRLKSVESSPGLP